MKVILFSVAAVMVFDNVLSQNDRPEYCDLPPLEGPDPQASCRAYLNRYTFDPQTKACVEYIYGGCNGSKNLYLTEKECMRHCDPSKQSIILKNLIYKY